jgi:DNA-binding transcriptional LysR family regulator
MLCKPLFNRQARGVAPTAAADDLARSIASQLDGIEATMGAARARSSHLSVTVYLVGPAEYQTACISHGLALLVEDALRLGIQTGNRERIYAALDEGHADLAVTASPDGSVHGFAELGRERLVLVAAPA